MEFSVKAKRNRVKIVLAFLAREKEGPGRELQTMLIFPHLTSPGLNRFSEEMSKNKKKLPKDDDSRRTCFSDQLSAQLSNESDDRCPSGPSSQL